MKRFIYLLVTLFSLSLINGCVASNAQRGAVLGGSAGAIGSVIGRGDGRTTALFAAGGALLGYALGNEVDKSEARHETYQNQRDIQNLQSRRNHVYDGRSEIFHNRSYGYHGHHNNGYYRHHSGRINIRVHYNSDPRFITECWDVVKMIWIRGEYVEVVEQECETYRAR